MPRDYRFEPDTLQYSALFNDGRRRIVSASSVAKDASRIAIGAREEMRALSMKLAQQQIPIQEWYDGMARSMKLSYYAAVSVARGHEPSEPLKAAEIAFLLWLLTRQFNYLGEFASEIEQGQIPMDGSFLRRAGMYGMATKSVFENWRLWTARINGWREARRILGYAEHCHDSKDRPGCKELADRGWMPIAQMTPLGEATCLSNCQCEIVYRSRLQLASFTHTDLVSQFEAEKQEQTETQPASRFIDITEIDGRSGKKFILFRYDRKNNIVEIKHKGMSKPRTIELDRYK